MSSSSSSSNARSAQTSGSSTISADDTVVMAGSGGVITDSAGNQWTITAGNTVNENGSAAGFTANVAEIAYAGGTVWHENTAGQWYSWNGWGWSAGADPLPASSGSGSDGGTAGTSSGGSSGGASPDDTVVMAGSGGVITDPTGNQWTITAANIVDENGSAAGFTANVAEIAYAGGTVWHENTAGQWYSWNGSGWSAGADPLSAAAGGSGTGTPGTGSGGAAGGGSSGASGSASGGNSGGASADDTVVMAGSRGVITDAAGNQWTITAASTVDENGSAAGFTANVAEIAYAGGTVWHENTAGQWYSWNGWGWTAGADPLPPSSGSGSEGGTAGTGSGGSSSGGATGGGSGGAGSGLDLSGYHLSFDWEANDFPNSPTPSAGNFATTLSSGLRYLSNGDQEYWADDSTGQSPFRLHDGVLDINATYVGAGNTPGGGSLSYTSGVLTTQGSFLQQYGYFEMRAQLPAGAGMWPAFWMLDDNSNQVGGWPPELDVLEAFGATNANGEGGSNQAHWGVHSQNAAQQQGGWATLDGNEFTEFHTYGVLWTPQTLTFYYDDKEVAQTPTPSDYTHKMYMIANLAVGGTWPGDATGENGTMSIDYIRAFSNDSAVPAVALQAISSPDGGGTSLYGATAASGALAALGTHA